MSNEIVTLDWQGPFGFFPDLGLPLYRTSRDAAASGLYLWTVQFGDEYRVNYPGMSSNSKGLGQRLSQDLAYSLDGKWDNGKYRCDPLVDVEQFFQGNRIIKNANPSPDEQIAARSDVERIMRAYRVLTARVDGSRQFILRVESAIIRHLWFACEASRRFLWRPVGGERPHISSKPGEPRLTLAMTFPPGIKVCGLEGIVEEKDWHEYTPW